MLGLRAPATRPTLLPVDSVAARSSNKPSVDRERTPTRPSRMTPKNAPPRVALFADSYREANGVARTVNALEAYAASRGFPFLCVFGGDRTGPPAGSRAQLELKRSRAAF